MIFPYDNKCFLWRYPKPSRCGLSLFIFELEVNTDFWQALEFKWTASNDDLTWMVKQR